MADYTGTNSEANRQSLLEKQREQMLQQFALQRSQIEKEHQVQMGSDKFVQELETMENNLKRSTVGLVKLEEFQRIRSELEERQSAAAAVAASSSRYFEKSVQLVFRFRLTELMVVGKRNTAKDNSINKKKKRNATKLTFQVSSSSSSSSSDETNQPECKRKKLGKDPTVDTSFLPDRDREAKERRMREQLRLEWLEKQEIIKSIFL